MPAADRRFPEDRDEMLQEIRSVPKQVIKKSEPPLWLRLLSPQSPMGGKGGHRHADTARGPRPQQGLAAAAGHTRLRWARNPRLFQLGVGWGGALLFQQRAGCGSRGGFQHHQRTAAGGPPPADTRCRRFPPSAQIAQHHPLRMLFKSQAP